MKKTVKRVSCWTLGILALFLPLYVQAHQSNCYVQFSYGTGTVRYLETGRVEDRFFSEVGEYVRGNYTTDPESRPHSFGLGCELYKFWGVTWGLQFSHRAGLKASVISNVALSATFGEYTIESDTYEIKRRAELSGYGLDITAKTNLYGPIYATGKIGAIYANASVSLSSPSIPYNIEVMSRIEGVVPVAGIGLLYQPKQSFAIGPECEFYGKYVRICSVVLRVNF